MTQYGNATEQRIREVVDACTRYGNHSIIALAGVPGTGKSYIASIAAQRVTNEPLLVREIQFHQSFSYEEFIEGLRIDESSGVITVPGVFQEWNERALEDEDNKYVLLIEELTRANLSAVLGELLTYLEHRERPFTTLYSRKPLYVAKNLVFLATYNPTDRTAIDLDAALIRRLRIIRFLPNVDQLAEMLSSRSLSAPVVSRLKGVFYACKKHFPEQYEHIMPFGHGILREVDLRYRTCIAYGSSALAIFLGVRYLSPSFAKLSKGAYPWRDPHFQCSDDPT